MGRRGEGHAEEVQEFGLRLRRLLVAKGRRGGGQRVRRRLVCAVRRPEDRAQLWEGAGGGSVAEEEEKGAEKPARRLVSASAAKREAAAAAAAAEEEAAAAAAPAAPERRDNPPSSSVYITSILPGASAEELKRVLAKEFSRFGEIDSLRVLEPKKHRNHAGESETHRCAFVNFGSVAAAEAAVAELGQRYELTFARPTSKLPKPDAKVAAPSPAADDAPAAAAPPPEPPQPPRDEPRGPPPRYDEYDRRGPPPPR